VEGFGFWAPPSGRPFALASSPARTCPCAREIKRVREKARERISRENERESRREKIKIEIERDRERERV
jgi:hypothetical protein